MEAIILAGGKGTRLKPYTTVLPKALMPIGDLPILEVVITQLQAAGFRKIRLAVGHLAELIEAFFGDGKKWGLEIVYEREDHPLGTAGPLKKMADLPENFLVMNADILTDLPYTRFFETHRTSQTSATIAVCQRRTQMDYGVIDFDPENCQIIRFREKPTVDVHVSMGVYAFNRRILQWIPEDAFFNFDTLMQTLLDEGEPIQVYPYDGYWLDIGRGEDYETAVNEFDRMKDTLMPNVIPV